MPIAPDKVWVVLPSYNEASVIGGVLREVQAAGYRVVVVDDASADATGAVAETAGVPVVTHPVNLGQGAALQTGIGYALGQGADYIVTFDADGQHRVADIAGMLSALQAQKADIAFGSRFLGEAVDMGKRRRFLLKLSARFSLMLTGIELTDTQNGLRVMTSHAARTIRIRQNRYAHAFEIIAQVGQHRLRYVEVPTTVVYTSYSRSKGQSLWAALSIMVDLLLGKLRQW